MDLHRKTGCLTRIAESGIESAPGRTRWGSVKFDFINPQSKYSEYSDQTHVRWLFYSTERATPSEASFSHCQQIVRGPRTSARRRFQISLQLNSCASTYKTDSWDRWTDPVDLLGILSLQNPCDGDYKDDRDTFAEIECCNVAGYSSSLRGIFFMIYAESGIFI